MWSHCVVQAVGVRELKAKLSRYLRMAREGEVVLVTDRGEVVAELRAHEAPASVPPELRGLWALAQHGGVRLGALAPRGPRRRRVAVCVPAGTARRLIDDDRAERFAGGGTDGGGPGGGSAAGEAGGGDRSA